MCQWRSTKIVGNSDGVGAVAPRLTRFKGPQKTHGNIPLQLRANSSVVRPRIGCWTQGKIVRFLSHTSAQEGMNPPFWDARFGTDGFNHRRGIWFQSTKHDEFVLLRLLAGHLKKQARSYRAAACPRLEVPIPIFVENAGSVLSTQRPNIGGETSCSDTLFWLNLTECVKNKSGRGAAQYLASSPLYQGILPATFFKNWELQWNPVGAARTKTNMLRQHENQPHSQRRTSRI